MLDTAPSPKLPPHLVVRGVLGHGGTAVVYDAFHARLETRVAVKVLALSGPGTREARARLIREAHICAGLDDPRFPRIYDVDTLPDGTPFVVLEHIRGTTLSDMIARGPLGVNASCTIASEILAALTVIHDVGIIHRDIKPANVILQQSTDASPRVRLVDFGIAKLMGIAEDAKGALTRHGELVGTPHYMSPEQLTGRALDARADLYAVGVMLYEMLTGRTPFDGPTISEVIASVLRDPLEPLRSSRPDCPPELAEIVHKAMERDPAQRYPSAQLMRDEIERVRNAMRSQLRLRVADFEGKRERRNWPKRFVIGALVALATWGTWVVLRPRDLRERFDALRDTKPTSQPERDAQERAPSTASFEAATPAADVAKAAAPTSARAAPSSVPEAPSQELGAVEQGAPMPATQSYQLELDLDQLRLDEAAPNESEPPSTAASTPRAPTHRSRRERSRAAEEQAVRESAQAVERYLEHLDRVHQATPGDAQPEAPHADEPAQPSTPAEPPEQTSLPLPGLEPTSEAAQSTEPARPMRTLPLPPLLLNQEGLPKNPYDDH